MKIRKPLFTIAPKYERAERERYARQADRNAIFIVLVLAGSSLIYSQCGSERNRNREHAGEIVTTGPQ